MVFGNFKGLTRRTGSNKILPGNMFNIAKNPKYDEYSRVNDSGGAVKNEKISNEDIAD